LQVKLLHDLNGLAYSYLTHLDVGLDELVSGFVSQLRVEGLLGVGLREEK